jgi:hypothetical protein
MTGDKVEKEMMVFADLSDLELAFKVRMLMRGDLDHEAVCVGARDRIMYLSQQLAEALEMANVQSKLKESAEAELERVDKECDKLVALNIKYSTEKEKAEEEVERLTQLTALLQLKARRFVRYDRNGNMP